jgi:hypothetical protein
VPGKHYQGSVLDILNDGWDMMIAHPPCTYLTVTGNKWFKDEYKDRFPTRQQDRKDAIEFFMALVNANIPKIVIENPIGIMSTTYQKPNQIIQPWQFGHEASKSTCLWIKGLPLLKPTNIVSKGEFVTFKSGKPVFDENTGIPPKGNFVYIQTGLENLDINQLASIAKYLDDNNWSLTVPSMSEPSFNQGRSVVSIFPRAKDYGLSDNVKVYPKKAENVTYTPTKTNVLGKDVTDKASCTKAINYLTACMKNPFKNADCQNASTRVKNVETASMCYLELSKQKTKNPTKLLGGIFGPEDELMRLVNVSNNVYGIGPRVRELGGTSSMNESKKINLTIKKHLLENIRQKNSWK